MTNHFFQVRRTPAADQSFRDAQKAVYGAEQANLISHTILFCLRFVAQYYTFVRDNHPDFKKS